MVLVLWWVGAILGNGHGIQGQNYVVFFSGREMSAGCYYSYCIVGIYCFRLPIWNVHCWCNGYQIRFPFQWFDRRLNFVISVVWSALIVGCWMVVAWGRVSHLLCFRLNSSILLWLDLGAWGKYFTSQLFLSSCLTICVCPGYLVDKLVLELNISLCNPKWGGCCWVVTSTPDLRVGWCTIVCVEGLQMIKLMVVSFCPIGVRYYSGK